MSENSDLTPPKLVDEAIQRMRQGRPPERFVTSEDGGVTVENSGVIWHLTTLKHAIRLESMGLRHSSGRSALALAKKVYGFTGNRAKVLSQLEAKLAQLLQEREEKF